MSVLSDITIKNLCQRPANAAVDWRPMINPFFPKQVRERPLPFEGSELKEKVLSYGVSSYGYDVRIAETFKLFTNHNYDIIDPLDMDGLDSRNFKEIVVDKAGHMLLPPHSFALGHTPEHLVIPRDVVVVCVGKSTYARAGLIVNVTPLEPEFEGQVVIEMHNTTPLPIKIYAYQGIAQFLFFKGDLPCETSYADKKGKYQGQVGVVMGRG